MSIGEMGGRGMGHWDGVPMAFLVRMVLEEAGELERGIAIFRDHPRELASTTLCLPTARRARRWG